MWNIICCLSGRFNFYFVGRYIYGRESIGKHSHVKGPNTGISVSTTSIPHRQHVRYRVRGIEITGFRLGEYNPQQSCDYKTRLRHNRKRGQWAAGIAIYLGGSSNTLYPSGSSDTRICI